MCNGVGSINLNFQTHHATSHTRGFTLGVAQTCVTHPYLFSTWQTSAHPQDLAKCLLLPEAFTQFPTSPSVPKALYPAL